MECANCGKSVFRHSPVNALWCERDRVFLCRSCTAPKTSRDPRLCPFCGQPISGAAVVAFPVALFGIVLFLIIGAALLSDNSYRNSLQATPEVSVGSLHAGDHVRLFDRISTSHLQVIREIYLPGPKNSGHWSWSGSDFQLVDGNRSVWVDVHAMLGNIYGDPPHTTGPPEVKFWTDGDTIAIVGTVGQNATGLVVHAEAAAATADGFANPAESVFGVTALAASPSSAGVAIYLFVNGERRVREHQDRPRPPGTRDTRTPEPLP
jgi:hypothetical protein